MSDFIDTKLGIEFYSDMLYNILHKITSRYPLDGFEPYCVLMANKS